MSSESTSSSNAAPVGGDETGATDDGSLPVFQGTPEDWWKGAEEITESHALERTYGDWYITKVRVSGSATPAFRLATPSRPHSESRRRAYIQSRPTDEVSEHVRRLIKTETPVAAWMTSELVLADVFGGSTERGAWIRKNSGRWQLLSDGRVMVNDHSMSELNPQAATIS